MEQHDDPKKLAITSDFEMDKKKETKVVDSVDIQVQIIKKLYITLFNATEFRQRCSSFAIIYSLQSFLYRFLD